VVLNSALYGEFYASNLARDWCNFTGDINLDEAITGTVKVAPIKYKSNLAGFAAYIIA
jgi:hypothetical protein